MHMQMLVQHCGRGEAAYFQVTDWLEAADSDCAQELEEKLGGRNVITAR